MAINDLITKCKCWLWDEPLTLSTLVLSAWSTPCAFFLLCVTFSHWKQPTVCSRTAWVINSALFKRSWSSPGCNYCVCYCPKESQQQGNQTISIALTDVGVVFPFKRRLSSLGSLNWPRLHDHKNSISGSNQMIVIIRSDAFTCTS